MGFAPNQPYNHLPLLPPQGVELETKAVLKKTVSASRALAELKTAGRLIPNQGEGVLLSTLGLQEAKLSSEIENIVTTQDGLYQALAQSALQIDGPTKEVLSYNQALWYGYAQLKSRGISTRLLEEIGQIIKPQHGSIRKLPGTRIVNAAGQTIYTPPEGESVIRDKLANIEFFFYQHPEIDPLVRMAVLHYQFEAIHPFLDGNGRTGRILNLLCLLEDNLLDVPVLYLSRYILENKSQYYALLRGVTEQAYWESWVLYMLEAVEQTANATCKKIEAIRQLINQTADQVRQTLPTIYRKELIEVLFNQPYCKVKFLVDAGIAKRQAAAEYLRSLEQAGVLRGIKRGREWYFLNHAFLQALSS